MHKLFHIDEKISQLIPLITDDFMYNRKLISLYYHDIIYDCISHRNIIHFLTNYFKDCYDINIIVLDFFKNTKWVYIKDKLKVSFQFKIVMNKTELSNISMFVMPYEQVFIFI